MLLLFGWFVFASTHRSGGLAARSQEDTETERSSRPVTCNVYGPTGGPGFKVSVRAHARKGASCTIPCRVQLQELFTKTMPSMYTTAMDATFCRCDFVDGSSLLLKQVSSPEMCNSSGISTVCWEQAQRLMNKAQPFARTQTVEFGNLVNFDFDCEDARGDEDEVQIHRMNSDVRLGAADDQEVEFIDAPGSAIDHSQRPGPDVDGTEDARGDDTLIVDVRKENDALNVDVNAPDPSANQGDGGTADSYAALVNDQDGPGGLPQDSPGANDQLEGTTRPPSDVEPGVVNDQRGPGELPQEDPGTNGQLEGSTMPPPDVELCDYESDRIPRACIVRPGPQGDEWYDQLVRNKCRGRSMAVKIAGNVNAMVALKLTQGLDVVMGTMTYFRDNEYTGQLDCDAIPLAKNLKIYQRGDSVTLTLEGDFSRSDRLSSHARDYDCRGPLNVAMDKIGEFWETKLTFEGTYVRFDRQEMSIPGIWWLGGGTLIQPALQGKLPYMRLAEIYDCKPA